MLKLDLLVMNQSQTLIIIQLLLSKIVNYIHQVICFPEIMVKDKEVQSTLDSRIRLITAGGGCESPLKGDYTIYIGNNPMSKDR